MEHKEKANPGLFELDKDDEEIIHSMIQENQLSKDLSKMDGDD